MSTAEATPVPHERTPEQGTSQILHGIIASVAWNAIIPVLLYTAAKAYLHASEFGALALATLFPVGESIWGLARDHDVDPIAGVVLFGIIIDLLALTMGGSPKLLLIRESFATGALGVGCFVSLVLPRPLMFYFGRYFFCGRDAQKRLYFDRSWEMPAVRHGNRLITSIWGIVFTGELVIRVALVYTLSAAAVLILSPIVLGVLTVSTIVWTLAYAGRLRNSVVPLLVQSIQAPPSTVSPS
ncbi:MAG: VC0807 family protein [Terriglobales bacterium]